MGGGEALKAEFFIGWDQRETLGWRVCAASLLRNMRRPYPISPISTEHLGHRYQRATETRDGKLWDSISGAHMATQFSLARFWTPMMAQADWAIFCDGDFMFRRDVDELIGLLDDRYCVMVVKHAQPDGDAVKMDGQAQVPYERKNWSSLMAFNRIKCQHHSLHELNTRPGLWLQQMKHYMDYEIGELPATWNHLVGILPENPDAGAAHFTLGTPDMPGWSDQEHAAEWFNYARTMK